MIRDTEDLKALLGVPYTEEQLEAITAPLEPAVIVAGAGSGKTTVMAARVVWLVGTGQVGPHEVLGLTFTNKAAAELAERIRKALRKLEDEELDDPDSDLTESVGEPTVSTYHAYADRLIKEHGLRLGLEPSARLLADATRYQLAVTAVRGPKELRYFKGKVADLADKVLALDGELSEHLVSPEELREHEEAFIGQAESFRDPKSGKAKRGYTDFLKAAEIARQRVELSELVERYRDLKVRRDLIDFGDQMVLGARLAEERPEVGAIEREKFKVVLLDEYQDTSVAQRRMLVGLFGGGHPVTAVGDPCQSIYGWRGASVANLDDFPDHFAKADGARSRGYTLSENRRSGGHLLEFANVVSDPLRQRHTGVRELRPSAEKADQGWTRVGLTETAEEEVRWVARMVADAHYRGGVSLREIAVLVRKGNQIPPLYEEMHAQGLPVEVVGLSGLVHLPEVADLIAMLDVLDEPIANASLVRLLTGPRWRIGARDLALLGMRARELVRDPAEYADRAGRDRLAEAVAGSDPTEVVSLSDAMADPGPDLPFSEAARVRFARFASEIRILRRRLSEPVLDVLHRVISVTGLDVEVAASPKLVAQRSSETLAAFLVRAADFQDLEGDQSVTAFRAYLKAAERHERGIDASLPSQGDSVKLLTMHKSKGLEWDAVFVPHLSGAGQKPRESWIGSGAVLPYPLRGDAEHLPVLDDAGNTAAFKSFKEQAKEYESWEDLRLEYVTVTRPRYYLTASGHWWGPTQKKRRGPDTWLSGLFEHCQDGHGEVVAWAAEPDPDAVNPSLGATEAHWPVLPDAEAAERRRIGAEMVVTALRRRQAEAFGEPIGAEPASEEPQAAEQPDAGAGEGALARSGALEPVPFFDENGEPMTDLLPAQRAPEAPGEPHVIDAEHAATAEDRSAIASWDRDLEALLEELKRGDSIQRYAPLPSSMSASQLLRYRNDPSRFRRELARPMPQPPQPSARLGTKFHAWIESLFGQQALFEYEDLPGAADEEIADEVDLKELQDAFLRTPWADSVPAAVEQPFQVVLSGRVVRGRIDAVYKTPDGWEVVDWKTSRSQDADPVQLAVYRLAWAEMRGVPLSAVSAAFVYVRGGETVRPTGLPDREELEELFGDG
ncbi:UvrD/REP helicase [Catenulispora acidiphila DSM 44928]|uniref:DNA 3'-5' helicase n=1 Tax=Catenulispora acidiphila (strain DSM 44928 / JCM 14897 / NBRC 102108 / NRRL B-24433 / ID139908) TaxID=479433 RepID=C7QE43_CATAD|nr:UvrD-helicase domain-containing protein [Catenulispora acidiphila]ACU76631.1 UvrD/REP helicase [Catenulispora acidiphila DSM 44928]